MVPWLVGTTVSGVIAAVAVMVTVPVTVSVSVTVTSIVKVAWTIIANSLVVLGLLHWPVATVVLHRTTVSPLVNRESVTAS